MLLYDELDLASRLNSLDEAERSVFAVSCSSRLSPVYTAFCEETKKGDYAVLCASLDLAWNSLINEKFDTSNIQSTIDRLLLLLQEHQIDDCALLPFADDAVASAVYALTSLLAESTQNSVWAARRVYEALDSYLVEIEGLDYTVEGAENEIVGSPLIQVEFQRQRRDLDELMANKSSGASLDVLRFRIRANEEPALVIDPPKTS